MKTLPLPLEKVGFVQREKKKDGGTVIYRCGRDFFYYALHFYFPEKFNPQHISSFELEKRQLLGFKLPYGLMWTMLQFYKAPTYFLKLGLSIHINGVRIRSYFHLMHAILFSRISYDEAMSVIERSVDEGTAVGVDISLGYGGILDHVIFVYGYDDEALYVLETQQLPMLEYEKLTDDERYFMKLPKEVVKKRWTRFGRVWEVLKVSH